MYSCHAFPGAQRYAELEDFPQWKDRLHVFGIDLRDLKATVRLTEMISSRFDRLDAIVNNAAQTVRRPPVFYQHLLKGETAPVKPKLQDVAITDVHTQTNTAMIEDVKASNALTASTNAWSSAGMYWAVEASDLPWNNHP